MLYILIQILILKSPVIDVIYTVFDKYIIFTDSSF